MTEPDLPALVTDNPWHALRRFTPARIALGRSGASLPTAPQLAFQLAHAQARDAVHVALDTAALAQSLEQAGIALAAECVQLHSAAPDRLHYLQRPDWGRRLCAQSQGQLAMLAQRLVLADGLSARATMQNAAPLLAAVLPLIARENWSVAPIAIVQQARVAIGDEIAVLLQARLVVILIGERPGLSAPDSLGAYLTWAPHVGCLDSQRNCISNIRPAGLTAQQAASKLHYLAVQMHQRQLSGVALKDNEPATSAVLTTSKAPPE
jgi:ethanolamine ammonia-lyase small subunit